MSYYIFSFILFYIISSFISSMFYGSYICRLYYSYKVSTNVLSFLKNYFLSFFIKNKHIYLRADFSTELDTKVQNLINKVLNDEEGYNFEIDTRFDHHIIEYVKYLKIGHKFNCCYIYYEGCTSINGERVLFSPVTILMIKKLENHKEKLSTKEVSSKLDKFF